MRKIVIVVAAVFLVFVALPIAAFYWIIHTPSGLKFALGQLDHLKRIVRIEAAGVRGDLVSGFHADHLTIDHERVRIVIDDLNARLLSHALWLQTVELDALSIRHIHIEIRPILHPAPNTPLKFLPSFLRVVVPGASVNGVDVVFPNRYHMTSNKIAGSTLLTSRRLRMTSVSVDGGFFTAAGSLDLGAANPLQLGSDLQWTLVLPDRAAWRGSAHVQGDLNELNVVGEQTVPVKAHIRGRALNLTQALHWEAQVESTAMDFGRLVPAAKITAKDISVRLRGDRSSMDTSGALTPTSLPTGRLEFRTHGPYPTRHLQFDTLTILGHGGTRIDAELAMNFVAGGPALSLRGRAQKFRWPMIGAPIMITPTAGFSLAGQRLPYRFSVDGAAMVETLPAFQIRASGLLDHDSVIVDSSNAGWLKGTLAVQGRLSWTGRRDWHFDVDGTDLDPGELPKSLPGRINVNASIDGAGLDVNADLDVRVARLNGVLRGQPLLASGRIRRSGSKFAFERINVHWNDARLTVDGTYGATHDLRFTLDAPHTEKVVPQLSGALTLRGHFAGPAATARLTAAIEGHALKGQEFAIAHMNTTADIDLSDRLGSKLGLNAQGVQISGRDFGEVKARLDGRASNHRFVLDAQHGLVEIHSTFEGAYAPKIWSGQVAELKLRSGTDVDVHLAAPARLKLGLDAIELQSLCLLGANERVCAEGDWHRDGPFNANFSAHGVPLHTLGSNLPGAPEYTGTLGLEAQFHGHSLLDVTGRLGFDIVDGTVRYKLPSGRGEILHLGAGHGEAVATPARIDASAHIAATEETFLDVKVTGTRSANISLLEVPVNGSIQGQARELGFIPLLLPQIDRASGQINADLKLAGSLSAPRFDGALILKNGEMDLYQVNLLMRAINAQLNLKGSDLTMAGSAAIGAGKASVAGNISWSDRKPAGRIKLKGEKLTMVNIPEMRADASPDIEFKIDGRRIDVGGSVTIPYARIRPADLSGATLSSGDEIIVGGLADSSQKGFEIYTDVKLILGDNVTVESYGLSGRLTGSVSVGTDPSGTARGSGELKIEEGKYAAYGRQLDIQRGRLIFTGGLVGDPAVDLRAVKVFPDVTAGVNVRGKLRNPQISFFSEPSLSQSQIVSILVAGGTLESLQSSGTQQVGQARNELLAQGGAIVAQQFGARLGIEDVGLESNTLNKTSLVFGKFLNPRLYVSYGISLTESINTIKLRYTLGDHWTIKTEAGQNRSSDLVFTIER